MIIKTVSGVFSSENNDSDVKAFEMVKVLWFLSARPEKVMKVRIGPITLLEIAVSR